MTLSIVHKFTSGVPNDPAAIAAGEVVPTEWNDLHSVTGTVGPEIGARTILTANTNYYVTVTGSDSNDGSLAHPWATPQHAMNFISASVDTAGFTITVNIGAGSFAGVDLGGMIGGGLLNWIGAGSSSTTVTTAASLQGCITWNTGGISAAVGMDAMTIDASSVNTNGGAIYFAAGSNTGQIGNTSTFVADDLVFHSSIANPWVMTGLFPALMFVGTPGTHNIRVSGSWLGIWGLFTGAAVEDFGAWTMVGTPSFANQAALLDDGGQYVSVGASYAGAATGQRFKIINASGCDAADSAGTFFPGNSAGEVHSGGEYTGITDFYGLVANLPAAPIKGAEAFVTNAAANPVFSATPTGGGTLTVPVYADGTNWRYG